MPIRGGSERNTLFEKIVFNSIFFSQIIQETHGWLCILELPFLKTALAIRRAARRITAKVILIRRMQFDHRGFLCTLFVVWGRCLLRCVTYFLAFCECIYVMIYICQQRISSFVRRRYLWHLDFFPDCIRCMSIRRLATFNSVVLTNRISIVSI